jgi:AbrB family transcriptional regulator (stage V sporulation protein T)
MKATGIVTNMDSLGQITIPAELHHSLRIHNAEQLEILVGEYGEIILRKFSPLSAWRFVSETCVKTLHNESGYSVLVCDRDQVVAVAGAYEYEMKGRRVTVALEAAVEHRGLFGGNELRPVVGLECYALVGSVIRNAGAIYGSVMLLSEDSSVTAGEYEKSLIVAAAGYLSNIVVSSHDCSC